MRIIKAFLLISVAFLAVAPLSAEPDVVVPSEPIQLFNGRNLDNFYTWLVDHGYDDPERVYSVVDQIDGAPAIRISGERWGGLITNERYADYHLIVEFRWGLATWGSRKDRTRDSGILLHCQGPDGNTGADFNGPWMRSVEFQIIEGGTGDIILVSGVDEDGERLTPTITATVSSDPGRERHWDPDGTPRVFEGGRVNWYGRDLDWEDVLGFRGPEDVEKPVGEWNRLDAFVEGDAVTFLVNGVIANKGRDSSLTSGKILFQSEGAEIYFRRIEIRPLP